MSRMEDLQPEIDEIKRRAEVFERATASIAAKRARDAAHGHAVMATVMSYGEGSTGTGFFARVSHWAKLFCIGFAMLAPSLLLWRVVF